MKTIGLIAILLAGVLVGVGGMFVANRYCAKPSCPSPAAYSIYSLFLRNDTPGTLKYVEVHYSGGSAYTDNLSPGGLDLAYIHLRGESRMEIAYADEAGREFCEEIPKEYLDKPESGTIAIYIEADGKVRASNQIEAPID